MANTKTLSTKEVGALKRTARSEALNDMAEADPEMFHQFMAKRYAEHGLGEYKPEPTPEQRAAEREAKAVAKAKAELDALIEKYPQLAGQVAPAVALDAIEDEPDVPDVDFGIDPALSRS